MAVRPRQQRPGRSVPASPTILSTQQERVKVSGSHKVWVDGGKWITMELNMQPVISVDSFCRGNAKKCFWWLALPPMQCVPCNLMHHHPPSNQHDVWLQLLWLRQDDCLLIDMCSGGIVLNFSLSPNNA